MQELTGKVAVVTGAASGIGRAIALALAGEGCKLAVIDIDKGGAAVVAAEIEDAGGEAVPFEGDVSVRSAMFALADQVFDQFGAVHLLVNNAGVTCFKPVTEMTDNDWDWMVGVNLMSIIHGYQAYLPRMLAQGEEGHVVNSSSGIGVVPGLLPDHTAYAATKGAGVALSSSLRTELAGSGIGVSVLCPAMVRTQILNSGRTRPDRFGGPRSGSEQVPGRPDPLAGALDPEVVGQAVIDGIRANRHFIFPAVDFRDAVIRYHQEMLADLDAAPDPISAHRR